uniref:Apple domain-containing protein n=1 Tax=Elaeophora elaphi TaxID=1147741 RepID=A0A0R3RJF9_9BILA
MEGEIIGKLQTSAFQDCLQHCSKQKKCTAVNFLIGVQEDPVCLLIDRTREGNEAEMPIPESVIYSAASFCLNQKSSSQCTDNTIWSFERFPNKDLIEDEFAVIAEGTISLEKCLTSCLNGKQCRAVLYDKKAAQCRYLNVSIQNVHNTKKFFTRSEDVDLYENNCFPEHLAMSVAQCQFIRMQSSGFTDFFDERIADVNGATDCEQLCLTWDSGNCRYFTYHRGTRMCYLSHTSPRTLNKNPLQNYDLNLSSVKLKCKPDRMHIHGASLKMFSGTIKTKNDKIVSCERKFFHVYEFDAEMLYNECGMQKALSPYLTFSNLVMLKEGSTELITVKDKLLKVICHIHSDLEILPPDQHLTFQFRIENENVTKHMLAKSTQIASSQLRNYVTQPRYTMEVMDVNKNPAEVVQIGDEGYLLLTLHEKPIKFSIIDLFARDTQSGKTFTIIDSDGCAVPNGMLRDIYRIDKNHLQLTIVFNGFSDEADIIYEAYAIPCDEFCDPNNCSQVNSIKSQEVKHNVNNKIKNRVRKRRSVMGASESRLFQLSGDIYAVKSSNKLKLKRKSWKQEEKSNGLRTKSVLMLYEESLIDVSDNVEGKSTAINQLVCITEDVKCLIIFLAMCLQALVLIVIVAITYIIIQQCVRQQRNSEIVELNRSIDNKQEGVSGLSES